LRDLGTATQRASGLTPTRFGATEPRRNASAPNGSDAPEEIGGSGGTRSARFLLAEMDPIGL